MYSHSGLIPAHLQVLNFPRLALGEDLKGTAADLTIGGEALRVHTRVDEQFKALSAKRALDALGDLHGEKQIKGLLQTRNPKGSA